MISISLTVMTGMTLSKYEWENEWSPMWNVVGSKLHFNSQLIRIAQEALHRAFGLQAADTIPPVSLPKISRTVLSTEGMQ
jgi:hypothetical protein